MDGLAVSVWIIIMQRAVPHILWAGWRPLLFTRLLPSKSQARGASGEKTIQWTIHGQWMPGPLFSINWLAGPQTNVYQNPLFSVQQSRGEKTVPPQGLPIWPMASLARPLLLIIQHWNKSWKKTCHRKQKELPPAWLKYVKIWGVFMVKEGKVNTSTQNQTHLGSPPPNTHTFRHTFYCFNGRLFLSLIYPPMSKVCNLLKLWSNGTFFFKKKRKKEVVVSN